MAPSISRTNSNESTKYTRAKFFFKNCDNKRSHSYLFPYPSENKADLELNFPKYVLDFNDVRPHGPLNGLTPTEAFRGDRMPEDFRTTILKKARLDRLAFNREKQCGICKK